MVRLGALLALLILAMPAVQAQTVPPKAEKAAEYTPPAWPKGPTEAALLGRLALITVLALVLGGIVIVIARRVGGVPAARPGEKVPLEIVGSVSLGSGCMLHLVQVEQTSFVVGADGTGLKAIQFVTEPFENLLEPAADPQVAPAELDNYLFPSLPAQDDDPAHAPSGLEPRRIA